MFCLETQCAALHPFIYNTTFSCCRIIPRKRHALVKKQNLIQQRYLYLMHVQIENINYIKGKENIDGTKKGKRTRKSNPKSNEQDDDFIIGVGESPLRDIPLNVRTFVSILTTTCRVQCRS